MRKATRPADLAEAIRRAARKATDPAVREWLRRLGRGRANDPRTMPGTARSNRL